MFIEGPRLTVPRDWVATEFKSTALRFTGGKAAKNTPTRARM